MSDIRVYAGIDIGGTSVKYGLFNQQGKILFREQKPTMPEKGPTPLMHLITNIAERLMYHAADEDLLVTWLGVGSPGAIDHKIGKVVGPSPNIAGWQGMEIGSILTERLNMPVFVDNDVNAMALAELKFGAAIGHKSVVCCTVGTGVGGAVIIDGRVWHGANSTGGELGHMTINFDGPKCACGNRGCIESYCSSDAIIARTKAHLKSGLSDVFEEVLEGKIENLTVKKLFAAVRKGDKVATAVVEETARYLGAGLAGAVNLLNPEVVVIGGGVTEGGGGFVEFVHDEIKQRAFSSATDQLIVAKAVLGNDAGFMGAGLLGEVYE